MALLDLDKPRPTFFTADFSDGLNSYMPATKISDNALTLAQNCLIAEDGVLTRRPGITRVGNYFTSPSNTPSKILDMLAVGAGVQKKIYILFGTSGAAIQKTWLTSYDVAWNLESTLNQYSSANANDGSLCWGRTGGVDFIYVGVAQDAAPPKLAKISTANPGSAGTLAVLINPAPSDTRYLASQFGRLWAVGACATATRNVAFYSDWLDSDNYDLIHGVIEFHSRHGSSTTGVSAYRDNALFIGLENGCYLIAVGTGNDGLDWEPISVSSDVGCGSHRSIANVAEDLFFIDQFGNLRSLGTLMQERGSGVRSIPISLPVKNHTDQINQNALFRACAAFYKGHYWLSFQKRDGSWTLLTYNVATQRWTGPHVLRNAAGRQLQVWAMTVSHGNLAQHPMLGYATHLYFATLDGLANTDSLQVYELDEAALLDDQSQTIEMDAMTRAFDMTRPHEEKILEHGEVEYGVVPGATGVFNVEARTDFEAWRRVASVDYTAGSDVERQAFNLKELDRGRRFQLRFRSSDRNTHPRIFGLTARMRTFEQKRNT